MKLMAIVMGVMQCQDGDDVVTLVVMVISISVVRGEVLVLVILVMAVVAATEMMIMIPS